MKKYTDESPCQKCGEEYPETKHHGSPFSIGWMRRMCDNCGFSWIELPLDAEDDEDDS